MRIRKRYGVILVLFFVCFSLHAQETVPVGTSTALGEIIFNVRDSVFNIVRGFKVERKSAPYIHILTNASSFTRTVQSNLEKNSERWSVCDRFAFDITRLILPIAPANGGPTALVIMAGQSQNEDWRRLARRFEKYGGEITKNPRIQKLRALVESFRAGNEPAFNTLFREVSFFSKWPRCNDRSLERPYLRVNPFLMAKIFCGIGLLALFILTLSLGKTLYSLGSGMIILGLFPQTFVFITRFIFTARPSVSTLYEPIIMIAWSGIMVGLFWELFQKDGVRLLIASGIGFAFITVVGNCGDGETIRLFSVALNEYFWVSTQIMPGILGYASMCALLVSGYIFFDRLLCSTPSRQSWSIRESLNMILTFGRVFTILGVVLGGMWTVHSWGNF